MIPSNKMCINSTHCTLITQQVISLSGHRGKNWPHVMLCVCVCQKVHLFVDFLVGKLLWWKKFSFLRSEKKKKKFLFTDHRKRRLVRDAIDFLCRCAPGKKWLLCRHKRPCSPSYLDCLFVRRHSISGVASVGNASFISVHCVTDQEAATFLSRRRWWRWWRRSTKMMHHHRPFSSSFFLDQGIFCRKCKWNFG